MSETAEEAALRQAEEADALDREARAQEDLEMRRGAEAQRILELPMVREAFDLIENQQLAGFRDSQPDQIEEREAAYRTLKVLDMFRGQLTEVMGTGKLAVQGRKLRVTQAVTAREERESDIRD